MSDLLNLISRTVGKQDVLRAVDFVGEDLEMISELVLLSCSDGEKVSMKASWVLRYVAQKNKNLVQSHLVQIIRQLEQASFSCQRSLLNTLEYFTIPTALEDETYTACFNILLNRSAPVANQACCMELLSEICLKHPDLSNELILVIEDLLINGSPGIKMKGKKVIKLLQKRS